MLISELLEPGCIVESYYFSMITGGKKIQLEHFLILSVQIRHCSGLNFVDIVWYDTKRNKIKNTTYDDIKPPITWLKIIYTNGQVWSQTMNY